MPKQDVRRPGILEMISRIEGGPYYAISQVAKMIGRDPDTIRRWQRAKEELRPTNKMELGDGSTDQFVWLYTQQDVRNLRNYSATVKVGRPRKEED